MGEKQSSSAKMFYDGIKQSKKDLEKVSERSKGGVEDDEHASHYYTNIY